MPRGSGSGRRERVIVGAPPQPWTIGAAPVDLDFIAQALEADEDITVLRRIAPRPPVRAFPGLDYGGPAIIAAEMPLGRAEALARHLQLVVEIDSRLEPAGSPLDAALAMAAPVRLSGHDPVDVPPFFGSPLSITVEVTDTDGQAVEGALVCASGSRGPALAVTDPKGRAELTLLEESPESVRSLSVTPARDHWARWIPEPGLDLAKPNTVVVERLDAFFPAFPDQELVGWGLRAMRIDQLPPAMQGEGARIAVVDSGAAAGIHPDLPSPEAGFDLVADNSGSWKDDVLAHGTHCLGVMTATSHDGGIRGIAPQADVIVLKVLPGGRCSTLIEALDRCIEEQVDVINLSLCTTRPSVLVEQRLQQARQLGIACIAAAGNTSGPVAYPASSSAVLAVAAVGRLGEFPPGSGHATQPAPGVPMGRDGFFAARLSAFGPEIDVCGPGVAVVSTVPPDGYGAWDGTSAAAAHVSGLATLLLAHHPDFAGAFRPRTAARVDRLFQILRRSARPLALGDPRRTGAGLPDALMAFGDVIAPPGPGVVWSPAPTMDLTAPLDQLAMVMHQAGIVNGNGGNGNGNGKGNGHRRAGSTAGRQSAGPGSTAAGGDDPAVALAQLRETLERAGIWRR
jgi:subtilisin family serine protease